MILTETPKRLKQANFFYDKFKKEALIPAKLYYLSATIIFTRSIYHIFDNEMKEKVKNNPALSIWVKNKMDSFNKEPWFGDIKKLRDTDIKKELTEPRVSFMSRPKNSNFTGKIKIISQFIEGNRLKLIAKDYKNEEVVELEENEVDFFLNKKIDNKNIEINSAIEFCLFDWQTVIEELKQFNLE